MQELIRITKKKIRRIIGVMSGTSLDGIDIALVRFEGKGIDTDIRPMGFRSYPMPDYWKQRIQKAFKADTAEICKINYDLGWFFSEQIQQFCKDTEFKLQEIDAIGFHGQTLYHVHQHSTLQSGEAEIPAQTLKTLVIHDFRSGDIAAGGSGAPLVPYLDRILFQDEPGNTALQNLGGIGNLTYLPKSGDKEILAFDTGPANAILNETVELMTNRESNFDKDGQFSKEGAVRSDLLQQLLQNDYFCKSLPKSTGREDFGKEFVESVVASNPDLRFPDLLRTFIAFITQSIFNACERYLDGVDKLYISGGGAHHPLIMEDLEQLFGKNRVGRFENRRGITMDSKEAVAFALLAHERLNNVPTNIPSVTGASRLTTLGKITSPY